MPHHPQQLFGDGATESDFLAAALEEVQSTLDIPQPPTRYQVRWRVEDIVLGLRRKWKKIGNILKNVQPLIFYLSAVRTRMSELMRPILDSLSNLMFVA